MAITLIGFILRQIAPEQYYKDMFPELSRPNLEGEVKVLSPFTKEKVPSLSVNIKTGEWYSFCVSDRRGGDSIVSFHAAYCDCSKQVAAAKLYHKYIHPIVPELLVKKWRIKLCKTPDAIAYLKSRHIHINIVKQYKIGWDGIRFTIPVYNEFDLCTNVRLYNPLAKDFSSKMINYTSKEETRPYGSPITLYPVKLLLNPNVNRVVICEGEWDTLSLLSLEIPAVTTTGGASTWYNDFNKYFRDRDVIIAYDNDEPGIVAGKKLVQNLVGTTRTLKRLVVPTKYGKDVNDLIINNSLMRTKLAWLNWLKKTKSIVVNVSKKVKEEGVLETVNLGISEATNEKYFGRKIELEGIITSKDIMPYLLPLKYQISCTQKCEDCPVSESEYGFKNYTIDQHSPDILTLLDSTKRTQYGQLLNRAGLAQGSQCQAKLKIISTFNVEFILIIPTLESRTHEYTISPSYYTGHGLKVNRPYLFTGTVLPHPRDQHAVFLFESAKPLQDEIETFKLTTELGRTLTKFRPGNFSVLAKLNAIADWQSRNITKIIERPDLHIAVDLAFHSAASFKFNGELVSRGMIDLLVLGDTRCGKGYVTQRLSKFYKLGDIASGDSCSFAGLVGGLQQIRNNWRITWGLIPLNNNRLVVIDEASSISTEEIARMSRIRSEGTAEIVKIIRESTQANARLIWLANPRSGRPIATYNTGVEAIKELIGAIEDISRFDLALTLATSEVPSEVINTLSLDIKENKDCNKYTSLDCRSLILWAWSRTVDQIIFTDKATRDIINLSISLSQIYSPVIPLVQGETIRLKLAKISAAIAARVFSTDSTFQNLVVNSEHVQCAYQILRLFYDKPSMAYHLFSKFSNVTARIENYEAVQKVITSYSKNELATITGLLEMHKITVESLTDYIGDNITARDMLGELVLLKCITRSEGPGYYLKNPEFTQWLRKRRTGLLKKG